jgi:hypothetical protein
MWATLAPATKYKTPPTALLSSLQHTSQKGYLKTLFRFIMFVVWLSPPKKRQAPLYVEFSVSPKKP